MWVGHDHQCGCQLLGEGRCEGGDGGEGGEEEEEEEEEKGEEENGEEEEEEEEEGGGGRRRRMGRGLAHAGPGRVRRPEGPAWWARARA